MNETIDFQEEIIMNIPIRVAVNGYGVIGKRVADAVRLQPDMELVGVADITGDYRIQSATLADIPIYSAEPDASRTMLEQGIHLEGELSDLLKSVDVIVDCTPAGMGAHHLQRYREHGVKAILQGG